MKKQATKKPTKTWTRQELDSIREELTALTHKVNAAFNLGDKVTDFEKARYDSLLRRLNQETDIRRTMGSDLERRINKLTEAIGGAIWRTQEGHARGIAFLSTEHLKNVVAHLDGRFEGPANPAYLAAQEELLRRSIDERYRKAETPAPKESIVIHNSPARQARAGIDRIGLFGWRVVRTAGAFCFGLVCGPVVMASDEWNNG